MRDCPTRRPLAVLTLTLAAAILIPTVLLAQDPVPARSPDGPVVQDPAVWPGEALPADAKLMRTKSGLRYAVLKSSDSKVRPAGIDQVKVHYTGWLVNGSEFDSSVKRGSPATFGVNQVIAGWTEGLQLMTVGAKMKFVIPSELGYGKRGSGRSIPPDSDLVFDVELLGVEKVDVPEFVAVNVETALRGNKGLLYELLAEGDGESCRSTDTVELDYTLWTEDGRLLESTRAYPRPFEAPTARIPLPGLKEAVQHLGLGGHARFLLPSQLCFGAQGKGPVPPGTNLICDLHVKKVTRGPDPVPMPEFGIPTDAELTTTASGLQYKIVVPGSDRKPTASETVTCHYAGWLTDGTLFDASYNRGATASFGLGQVIAGWTEGLQLIGEGGQVLLVIPYDLAYGERGRPGTIPPKAKLVFHVELVKIGR